MTPLKRRRLGVVLVGIASLIPVVFQPFAAGASPIDDKRAEAQRLAAEISRLDDRVSVLDEQYNQAQIQLTRVQQGEAKARDAEQATMTRFQAVLGKVRARAVSSYMRGGGVTKMAQLVGSKADEIGVRNRYLESLNGSDQAVLDELHAARDDLHTMQGKLDEVRQKAEATKASLDKARKAGAAAISAQQKLLSNVNGELANLLHQEQQRQAAAAAARAQAAWSARQARATGSAGRSTLAAPRGPAPPVARGAAGAVQAAQQMIGRPYQWGGSGPNSFDCSGLTAYAWGRAGVSLPHSASGQYASLPHVSLSEIQPGDLVFYGHPIHHVGIYAGGGMMVEAPHSGVNVRMASMMRPDLVGVARP